MKLRKTNPYKDAKYEDWADITKELVEQHPLTPYIVDFCLKSWDSLLNSKINPNYG